MAERPRITFFKNLAGLFKAKPPFNRPLAEACLRACLLPILYERMLGAGHEAALGAMMARVPQGAKFQLLRHGHVTVAVLDSPEWGVIVAYDGMDEIRDMVDNARSFGKPHPLGGVAHGGFSDVIFTKDAEGRDLSGQILAAINRFAAGRAATEVTITGISRGGALAMATAAQLILQQAALAPGVTIARAYTFGDPPYGDEAFVAGLKARSGAHLTDVWHIAAAHDKVPGKIQQGEYTYVHVGHQAFLVPPHRRRAAYIIVDPHRREEVILRDHAKTFWYDPNEYARQLGLTDAFVPELSNEIKRKKEA